MATRRKTEPVRTPVAPQVVTKDPDHVGVSHANLSVHLAKEPLPVFQEVPVTPLTPLTPFPL